jgi:hypothetical protein
VKADSTCLKRILLSSPAAKGDGYKPLSPLVAAAALGHIRLVELMLPTYRQHLDLALVVAAGGRPDADPPPSLIRMLIGAKPGKFGGHPTENIALGIAVLRCHKGVVEEFKTLGHSTIPGAFEIALNNPMHAVDERLYELGVNNMWIAAEKGDLVRLRRAVSAKGNVNAATSCGETALMSAAKGGQVAVIQYLLSIGADAAIRDDRGRTALDYAGKDSLAAKAIRRDSIGIRF